MPWECKRHNAETSAEESLECHKLSRNKLWVDENSKVAKRGKKVKMQWLQDRNLDKYVGIMCESNEI